MNDHYRKLQVCTLTYGKIWGGGIPFFGQFLKILMVSDKTFHNAFIIHKTINQTHLEKIFIFTIYQN